MNQAYAEPDQTRRNELIRAAIRAHTAEWPYIYLLASPTYVIGGPKVRDMKVDTAVFWRPDTVYKVE
jgi:ABC-type transport system substrate-binding protein